MVEARPRITQTQFLMACERASSGLGSDAVPIKVIATESMVPPPSSSDHCDALARRVHVRRCQTLTRRHLLRCRRALTRFDSRTGAWTRGAGVVHGLPYV